uniref:RNA-dependent RNA polymerase n=1 Tax=Bruce virus TaxID=2707201 RepID=A0A6H0DHD3_9VIRU|nr:MAG: RNA-dependent RNA polymerase [Bruce virus]
MVRDLPYHECFHQKIRLEADKPYYSFTVPGGYSQFIPGRPARYEHFITASNISKDGVAKRILLYGLKKLREFSPDGAKTSRLVRALLPKAEDYLPVNNIYTSIIELADMKEFIPGLLTSVKRLMAVKPRGATDAWLWTNFALLPTIQDFANLYQGISGINSLIAQYNILAEQGRTQSFSRTIGKLDLDRLDLAPTDVYATPNVGSQRNLTNSIDFLTPKVVYKLNFTFRYLPMDSTYERKLFSAVLGLDDLISGIWNGLPFSWLVDYFLNVGDILDDYLHTPLFLPYEIVNAGFSRKLKSNFTGSRDVTIESRPQVLKDKIHIGDGNYVPPVVPYTVPGERVTTYCRYSGELTMYQRTRATNLLRELAKLQAAESSLSFHLPSLHKSANASAVFGGKHLKG